MIQHIVDAPLVIVDLTGLNPNVFSELAIRHTIRRPLVRIITQGVTIPFDVAGTRTIETDHNDSHLTQPNHRKREKNMENRLFDNSGCWDGVWG